MVEQAKEVQIGETKQINLPDNKIDVKQHVGKNVEIAEVKEYKGQYGFYIKVFTETLETIENANGDQIEIKASRVFGLQKDEEGNDGWGKDTNLGRFLDKMEAKHYKDLIGKEVTVITQTNKKDNKDYLTFN